MSITESRPRYLHESADIENMTIGDLVKSGDYGEFGNYIFTDMTPDHWNNPLKNYGYTKSGFGVALPRMAELAAEAKATGKSFVHYLYEEEDRLANWDKQKVCLLHFPGPADAPYAIVIPGGALNRQWGLIEGQAIAARLNQLGYSAFVLYYRTKQEPVMDKALCDMYQAIRYVEEHAEELSVQKGKYIIGGFSAGAILAQEIGTTNLGYQTQGLPRPQLIFLGYTACQFLDMYRMWEAAPQGSPVKKGAAVFLRRLGGPDFTEADIAPYNVLDYIDESYPLTYIVANEDDHTVGVQSSHALDAHLCQLKVPHRTRIGQHGDHSFGLGIGLEVDGWLDEAVSMCYSKQ